MQALRCDLRHIDRNVFDPPGGHFLGKAMPRLDSRGILCLVAAADGVSLAAVGAAEVRAPRLKGVEPIFHVVVQVFDASALFHFHSSEIDAEQESEFARRTGRD